MGSFALEAQVHQRHPIPGGVAPLFEGERLEARVVVKQQSRRVSSSSKYAV
jgi:hypothetical protein